MERGDRRPVNIATSEQIGGEGGGAADRGEHVCVCVWGGGVADRGESVCVCVWGGGGVNFLVIDIYFSLMPTPTFNFHCDNFGDGNLISVSELCLKLTASPVLLWLHGLIQLL